MLEIFLQNTYDRGHIYFQHLLIGETHIYTKSSELIPLLNALMVLHLHIFGNK